MYSIGDRVCRKMARSHRMADGITTTARSREGRPNIVASSDKGCTIATLTVQTVHIRFRETAESDLMRQNHRNDIFDVLESNEPCFFVTTSRGTRAYFMNQLDPNPVHRHGSWILEEVIPSLFGACTVQYTNRTEHLDIESMLMLDSRTTDPAIGLHAQRNVQTASCSVDEHQSVHLSTDRSYNPSSLEQSESSILIHACFGKL